MCKNSFHEAAVVRLKKDYRLGSNSGFEYEFEHTLGAGSFRFSNLVAEYDYD